MDICFAFGKEARDAALGAGRELVAQAHVGEGAAHHDFVIAAARAVGVEVGRLDAVLGEVFSGGAVGLDGAGGRDVVGGDGVAENGEHARAGDVGDGRGRHGHAVEVGRLADVGRVRLPLVDVAGGEAEALPAGVASVTVAYSLRKPSLVTACSMASETSFCVGQMSWR